MICPPLVLCLGVPRQRCRVSLWLPLFLVWPVAAAVVVVLAPLGLITAAILWPFGWGKTVLFIGPGLYQCLCALRGLKVDVKQRDRLLLISFQ